MNPNLWTKNSRIYHTWQSMKDRCFNSNNKSYPIYGGRGISVCQEWKHNFSNFREWAMQNGYTDTLTIDRKDNNGNYEPDNCRWVTRLVQNNNKSSNVLISHNGETHNITEWEKILCFKKNTLYSRIFTYGIPIDEAFDYKKIFESKDKGRLDSIDISSLQGRNREIILMRRNNLSFRKIGASLGISKTTVMSIVYQLIKNEEEEE